ncbi:unnamed protein product [Sympodiomycopsis kandeliae]
MATSSISFTPPTELPALPTRKPSDIHTLASIDAFRPLHLHLDWTVDWQKKIIHGSVEHTIKALKDGQTQITFDSSYLDIQSVSSQGTQLDFKVEPRKGSLGAPLVVSLPQSVKADEEIKLKIAYSTTSQCTALGWLAKEQTAAKTAPFLYSQCQAIHCRSLVPIFDSPWWKITYTATVKSQYPILMSALPVDPSDHSKFLEPETPEDAIAHPEQVRTYAFSQKVSIPSYLIAIVAGHLGFAFLGPRTGLWAEKPDLARCKWEFEEGAEKYLEALEDIVSPYSWTRYDSVVLPPSFPYGGMENANMTTLTPALIVGDRSQTDVLLHELSHSWSGNLTSCGVWSSFWLNEGINVYLERLALQYVHGPKNGPAYRGFSYIIGAKALVDARKNYTDMPRFQRLVPVFEGTEDPDDAFSSIPYEAGSNLILHLEQTVGGLDNFLPFIKSYFKVFFDRSVTTQDFLDHLFNFYASSPEITKALKNVNWDAWLHGEGIDLPVKMEYDDTLAKQSVTLAKKWLEVIKSSADPASAGFSHSDVSSFDTDQIVVFLERIHEDTSVHVTEKYSKFLDQVYNFSKNYGSNGEAMLRFYEVALEDKDSSYKEQAAQWVSRQGRMKYNRPVYRSLYKIAPELARSTFSANKGFYHPIAASMIEKDLNLAQSAVPNAGMQRDDKHSHMIVVLGSTGSGKSQLGIDIAKYIEKRAASSAPGLGGYRSGGIISCDSMQVYHGLDVITNKATSEEMGDVRHELIDFLPIEEEYSLSDFITDATRLSTGMLDQRQLPITVGGTAYYVQHLLFPGHVVTQRSHSVAGRKEDIGQERQSMVATEPQTEELKQAMASLSEELCQVWETVLSTSPTALPPVQPPQLWALLNALDPVMASRWHPQDGRKISNSLRVIIDTGRQCSEWIKMQESQSGGTEGGEGNVEVVSLGGKPLKVLFLWVWAPKTILDERLDKRVDKMIDRGLLEEIKTLRSIVLKSQKDGQTNYTKGIFQAIGYKEFSPFLEALDGRDDGHGLSRRSISDYPPALQSLFYKGLDEMKTATRQYAKKQIQWISNQLIPEISQREDNIQIAILDTSDVSSWTDNVRLPAEEIVKRFLNADGNVLPESVKSSTAFQTVLQPLLDKSCPTEKQSRLEANQQILCELCTTAVQSRWESDRKHLESRGKSSSQVSSTPPSPIYFRAADEEKHKRGKSHQSAIKFQKSLQRLQSQGTLVEDGEEVERKKAERARKKEEALRAKAEAEAQAVQEVIN